MMRRIVMERMCVINIGAVVTSTLIGIGVSLRIVKVMLIRRIAVLSCAECGVVVVGGLQAIY